MENVTAGPCAWKWSATSPDELPVIPLSNADGLTRADGAPSIARCWERFEFMLPSDVPSNTPVRLEVVQSTVQPAS